MPFQIIPAIDLIDGHCVRLTQGDYNQKKVYNANPVAVAKSFEDAGIKRLHLVDLDGAKAKHIVNWKVLQRIAEHTRLEIDFGGGIRTDEDIRIAFESGAKQITGGSIAVKEPEVFLGWLEKYGADKIILGADAKNGQIAINGWEENTAKDVSEFIGEYMKKGITHAICTDISKDGMEQGPSLELYQQLLDTHAGLQLIASGGVGSIEDLKSLQKMGMSGAIVGKAIYEKNISLAALASFA